MQTCSPQVPAPCQPTWLTPKFTSTSNQENEHHDVKHGVTRLPGRRCLLVCLVQHGCWHKLIYYGRFLVWSLEGAMFDAAWQSWWSLIHNMKRQHSAIIQNTLQLVVQEAVDLQDRKPKLSLTPCKYDGVLWASTHQSRQDALCEQLPSLQAEVGILNVTNLPKKSGKLSFDVSNFRRFSAFSTTTR